MRSQFIFILSICLTGWLHSAKPPKDPAPSGDGEYHFHLGMNHYTGLGGQGGKPDYAAAVRHFQLAANEGHARAQGQLGICLLKGRGTKQNHDLALRWLGRAADKKDAIALFTLGNFHAQAKDYTKANKFYLDASARGHAAAMNNLGTSHEHGHGVPANLAEAAKWYTNAARMNLAAAQCNLALMHAAGRGMPKDAARALELYRAAAEQGDVRAQFLLGTSLHFGTLSKPNPTEATKWLQLAANQGHTAAGAHLAAVSSKLTEGERKTVDKQVSAYLANAVRPGDGAIGSGFFITNQGHLLTTHHLVARAESIEVLLNGRRHLARLLKADPINNIALLKIKARTQPLTFSTRKQVHLGLPVFTLGLPPQDKKNSGPKYSHGAIRKLTGRSADPRHLLADLNVQPDHSGAPLLDSSGQAIGMVFFHLDELKAYHATGSLPHSRNTALNSRQIFSFLNAFPTIRQSMPRHAPDSIAAHAGAESATTQILVQ